MSYGMFLNEKCFFVSNDITSLFFTGQGSMCSIRLWIRHLHVHWRIPFIRGRNEGEVLDGIISYGSRNCYVQFAHLLLDMFTGFPAGTVEWALRCCSICHCQHHLGSAIPGPDMLHVRDSMLLHGASSSWFLTLHLLHLEPLRQCHCC